MARTQDGQKNYTKETFQAYQEKRAVVEWPRGRLKKAGAEKAPEQQEIGRRGRGGNPGGMKTKRGAHFSLIRG